MNALPVKRRLAAILAADAVGYSRMMGADEEGTLRILAAHRTVIDGIIAFHHGRIVGTAGDSVLAEFESAVEAVRCAVEVQDALKTRNDALPETERMVFRIGVNLGDVMVSGDNLHGDGVNVAARLESACEPGGVFIASSVYDQIAGKLNLSFVDVGSRELKNIARPIHIYKLAGTAPAKPASPGAPSRSTMSRAWLIGAGAAALVAAAAAWQVGRMTPPAHDNAAEQELAKARAEAAEAKRQLELQRERQARMKAAESKSRAHAKGSVEAKSQAETASSDRTARPEATPVARSPAKTAVAPEKPAAAPESKTFIPRWIWSTAPQKTP